MDQFWRSVVAYLDQCGWVDGRVVAPAEFSQATPVDIDYQNTAITDADTVRALVLHKGRYRELDRFFLRRALRRLQPGFANPVFIVLTATGTPLPPDDSHLAKLPEITAWADAEEAPLPPVEPAKRMAATYVGNGLVLAETNRGHLLLLPGRDHSITPHIIRNGCIDPGITRYLEQTLRPGMTYVEVGAGTGVYSVVAAGAVGDAGRVLAIEARAGLSGILHDNLAMNGFGGRSKILTVAAAEQAGEVILFEADRFPGGGTDTLAMVRPATHHLMEAPREVRVLAMPLSRLLTDSGIARTDLIKIDVAGRALEILQGALEFLHKSPEIRLLIKWRPSLAADPGRAARFLSTLTGELNCSLEVLDPEGWPQSTDPTRLNAMERGDILACRKLS